jgi:hypothetical protein
MLWASCRRPRGDPLRHFQLATFRYMLGPELAIMCWRLGRAALSHDQGLRRATFSQDDGMPRVLLTGSSGKVGRAARPALETAGWTVRPLDLADHDDLASHTPSRTRCGTATRSSTPELSLMTAPGAQLTSLPQISWAPGTSSTHRKPSPCPRWCTFRRPGRSASPTGRELRRTCRLDEDHPLNAARPGLDLPHRKDPRLESHPRPESALTPSTCSLSRCQSRLPRLVPNGMICSFIPAGSEGPKRHRSGNRGSP